jgi:hypothetical protein
VMKIPWAAMPRTRRRALWASASCEGSFTNPFQPSMVLRKVA